MKARDTKENPDQRSFSIRRQDVKKSGRDVDKRFLMSNISDSELTETHCPVCGHEQRKFMFTCRDYPVWRCGGCDHIYVSPVPSEAVLADYYATGYLPETEDEKIWEARLYRVYNAAAKAIAEFMPQRGDLLDVGAGFGGFLERAAKNGWRLWGVEPSESAFLACKKRFRERAQLQQASFESARFAPASIDCIIMLNVIEHLRDPLRTCKRAFEILRPGGCLALRWPQNSFSKKLAAPAHLHVFTRYSMETLFHNAGFTEVRECWADTQDYRYYGLKKYLPATILRCVARAFLACTLGKRQIPFVTRLTLGRKPRQTT